MFFSIILLTFLQILHSKIPSPGKLVKTRHIWRHNYKLSQLGHDVQNWSVTVVHAVNMSTTRRRVELGLCRYKRAFSCTDERAPSWPTTSLSTATHSWKRRPFCSSVRLSTCRTWQNALIGLLSASERDKVQCKWGMNIRDGRPVSTIASDGCDTKKTFHTI